MHKIIKKTYIKYSLIAQFILVLIFSVIAYNSIIIPKEKIIFYLPSSEPKNILKTLNTYNIYTYDIDEYVLEIMPRPKVGWYLIGDKQEGRIDFFKSLHSKKIEDMQIKIFAGETTYELTKRLANDMKLDQEKLLCYVKRESKFQEGDILAGTYNIARKMDEETLVKFLFSSSQEVLEKFIQKNFKERPSDKIIKHLITIASIIQKESNSIAEMPLISSVIHNRLKKNMRLQMDGTLNYGKYSHTIVTPERIKDDNSTYNTYKHKGLPPAPLSSISLEALQAAYMPKYTSYLFFMLTPDGTHTFAATYKKHLANIRSFREAMKKKNMPSDENNTDNNSTKTVIIQTS